MRNLLRLVRWLVYGQIGFGGLKRIRQVLRGIPRYLHDLRKFRKVYKGNLKLLPCLIDWYEESGTTRGEYFWQDLYVARQIYHAKCQRHVDIGSRVDGFIAHVASFRQIEVFDIRPNSANIPGVLFKQVDMMKFDDCMEGYCDSVSCLHALEHFGLGRYGDQIDPLGHELGFRNMARMLSDGGTFYLAVPIGIERVEFNGQRVFNPRTICTLAKENGLSLKDFVFVGPGDLLMKSPEPNEAFQHLSMQNYALGIFIFYKPMR